MIPKIFPALESVHIFGVGCLAGSITLANLARLGMRGIPDVGRWRTLGAWLVFVSGPLMFTLNSARYSQNDAFLLKIFLLAAALGIELYVNRQGSKTAAAVSLMMWSAVTVVSRFIADFG